MRRRLAAIAARTSSLGVKQTLHVWHTKHKPKQIVSSVSQSAVGGGRLCLSVKSVVGGAYKKDWSTGYTRLLCRTN